MSERWAEGDTVDLLPYVPWLLREWPLDGPDPRHQRVRGTLALVDISGFTRLTERLARLGIQGAEELSDLLDRTFAVLLDECYADGADLVKWGGDAVLLLFQGSDHPTRAARAAHRMRTRLRTVGRLSSSAGPVTLRMSVGIHSGEFDFFLVGDPSLHREMLICGPAASTTATMEQVAEAGQIGLSSATASLLPAATLGAPLLDGRLLRSAPARTELLALPPTIGDLSPTQVLPPPIRAHLMAGRLEAEHRLITVAFVKYSGTDHVLRSSGPHVLADALEELVVSVQHACADHDVTFFESDIDRDGGKIMLTAGAPLSADHDEERMLRVARQVVEQAGRLTLRIGVNRGHVFSGDFGPSFRRTYSVKGDAINLAARLTARAAPGQVLATPEVLERSRTVFRTRDLPPFRVKGKSQAVRAADVGERLGTRAETRPPAPLVGRTTEVATLEQAVTRVREGRGQLVEIVGEAGVGKSRLATQVLAGRDDLHLVLAPCEQYESSTPYFPFRRLLRGLFEVPSGAGPAQVGELLTSLAARTAPDLVPWVPLLGVPLDVPLVPTRETRELDPRFRKERLTRVVTGLLRSSLGMPTALLIEDAHFMDEASVELLQAMWDQLDGTPLLVVITRQEPSTSLATRDAPSATTLTMGPLAHEAALDLTQAMSQNRPLTPEVASQIVARAGGNPMFLEALILEATRVDSSTQLPESVQGLITSQIDRLEPPDRKIVRYAAVFGTLVDETALDALLVQQEGHVPSGAMLRLADFLERDAQGRLRFRNALIRDVAYEGLPFSRRRALHEHVGETLERASPTPDDQSEVLSLHFFHADRHDKAWHYSLTAADHARAKYAHGEAVQFLARATHSAARLANVDPGDLACVYEHLADSRWLLGLTHEAAQAYAAARRCMAGNPVRLAHIIEKEARVDQRRHNHSLALRRISTGFNRLRGQPGSEAAVARSLLARRYAHSKYSQGRVIDALHWADIAAGEAEEAADKDALAQAYEMLNFLYASTGQDEPLPYGRLALQAYVELDNLPRQGHCWNNLAMQDYAQGRWQDALTNLERASELFHRIGDTAAEANALYNQAELLVRQRRLVEAQALLPGVLRIARAVEDDELVALTLREQARAALISGDPVHALVSLDEARGIFLSLEEHAEVWACDLTRAEALLAAGRTGDADTTVASLSDDPATPPTASLHRVTGRVRLAQGRLAEARAAIEAGLTAAEEAANQFEEAMLLLTMGELARREDRPASAHLDRARELLQAMGVRRSELP